MERRPRRSKKEKLEEELQKTVEAIEQYKEAIVTMEERKVEIQEAIENERVREVTKLMKVKNLTVDQLMNMIGTMDEVTQAGQGA